MLSCVDSESYSAWTNIGIGARLAIALRSPSSLTQSNSWKRACWSLYALDCTYGASLSMSQAFSNEPGLPDYPNGQNIVTSESRQIDKSLQRVTSIDRWHFRLLSIWSHAMIFLGDVQKGQCKAAWLETGPYQGIVLELYSFEANVNDFHSFRNVQFARRSSAELQSDRSYWAPWVSSQILYHAIQALIHHPFLHLMKRDRLKPPPSFVQRMVDQLLLHSSWVTRCINLCDEQDFQINDPFMAHAAAVVATGYLFFLDANDSELAQQARQGFQSCYDFIQRLSTKWSHLKNTVSSASPA